MPSPVRIEADNPTRLVITWDDGSRTEVSAGTLRAACPCASCREGAVVPPGPVAIATASLVGGYAINLVFAPDGHATGIYPFSYLEELGRAP